MPSIKLFITLFGLLYTVFTNAQTGKTNIEANAKNWTAYQGEATFNGDNIYLKVTREPGILWVNNTNFKNGIVELDIKGNLVGVAFHALDNNHYDAVYFRPRNFTRPEKKNNAIQYIDMPDSPWYKLREAFPGKYESSVQRASDPDDWFHAKIVIDFPEVKVYVNGAEDPSMVVEQISKRKDGKLGLWVDVADNDGWFKNVTITESK